MTTAQYQTVNFYQIIYNNAKAAQRNRHGVAEMAVLQAVSLSRRDKLTVVLRVRLSRYCDNVLAKDVGTIHVAVG